MFDRLEVSKPYSVLNTKFTYKKIRKVLLYIENSSAEILKFTASGFYEVENKHG